MAVGDSGSTTLGGRLVFGGVASGLDTNALIKQLIAVEGRPLIRLEDQKSDLEDEKKLYQELNTKLLALRDKARAIDNRTSTLGTSSIDEELLAYKATSADENTLTASTTGEATPGSYDVVVGQLATVGRELSSGQASQDTALGLGAGETLTIDYGGTDTIDITVNASTTLLNIRDAINVNSNNNGNVQASVLYDGTDYHLIIAGTQSGESNDIVVTESAGLSGFIDPALEQAAQNSIIQVLGIVIERDTNEIDDALEGVTLNLRGVSDNNLGFTFDDPPTATNFSDAEPTVTEIKIETDVPEISKRLKEFTDAFNEVRNFIDSNSEFDEETKETGPFSADATIRSIELELQTQLVESFQFTNGGAFQGLAEIGIEFNANGRLTLDEETLEAALVEDISSVKRVLGGDPDNDEDGAASAIARYLEPITRSGDGTFAVKDDSFDTQIESLETRIDQFTLYLQAREESMIKRFTALETFISALQSQSGFLSSL